MKLDHNYVSRILHNNSASTLDTRQVARLELSFVVWNEGSCRMKQKSIHLNGQIRMLLKASEGTGYDRN
jgi:hypothetical protein